MQTSTVPVLIGDCLCPGAPHEDGDSVYLRAKLGLAAGVAVNRMLQDARRNGTGPEELTGRITEAYLLHGVESWTLMDESGPIPVTPETIRAHLLDDFSRAWDAANRADELYSGPILDPLVNPGRRSSSSTSSNGSTSAPSVGSPKAPKRSKRSSTSTTPTAVTEATSG